ncbi:FAD-dependent monooxygenase [Rhodococcoides fascians]|uniref:FAD-dependent monooxygenase n=1 Tax=Rhodococcoides fascians TaxID=1828 RepID=UPI00055EE6B7|nr:MULTISPECIES: FAD-dependent monooxygenase [Rhodococcus]OZF03221.1 hypothetical protein CH301_07225 [Rhodococcus sp. 15-1189-1-1a]OZF17024.1 hypothetical protein CH299_07775 [Rhodococcus sp. 14-2686-1-2]
MYDVVIVGSGPTGLMLAAELKSAGVDALLLDRRSSQDIVGSRGGGIHSRTIELLDQRGIAQRFLDEGTTVQVASFAGTGLDIGQLPTRHPYTLALFQNHIERLLLEHALELGVTIRRTSEVTSVDCSAVDNAAVVLDSGERLDAQYVVGADGGRSVVRRESRIDFVGPDATRSSLIADVSVTEELPTAGKIDERGVHGLHAMGDGTVRVVLTEKELQRGTEPSLDDLRRGLVEVFGTDFGVHSPTWLSRFTDATRQAASYRKGRILLAGDAAHVHSPTGGQGIGLGLQDAVNLGWKLAQVVRGTSSDALLDTYHSERHPAGARALKYTMAQSLFQKADPRQEAMKDLLDEIVVGDGATRMAALISGLDVTYEMGVGHPLLGRRMPDLDLVTDTGPTRVFELLHSAAPVLLEFSGPSVNGVRAQCDGPWELPVIGEVPAPTAILVRPDGYVAWVGEGTDDGLPAALTTWFGGTLPG